MHRGNALSQEAVPLLRGMCSSSYVSGLDYAERAGGLAPIAWPRATSEPRVEPDVRTRDPDRERRRYGAGAHGADHLFSAHGGRGHRPKHVAYRLPPAHAYSGPLTWADLYGTGQNTVPRWLAAAGMLARANVAAPLPLASAIVNFRSPPGAAFSAAGFACVFWTAVWDDADDDANCNWVERVDGDTAALARSCYINEIDVFRRPARARRCYSEAAWPRLETMRARDHPGWDLPPVFSPGAPVVRP